METTLHIFDKDFKRVGDIRTYNYVFWQEDYYGRGEFRMECDDTLENIAILQQGYYVYRKDRETAMVIRYVHLSSEENLIRVQGYTTVDLLYKRIVVNTQKVRNVESGMYSLVADILEQDRRGLEHVIVAEPQGMTDIFETQFTLKNLGEALEVLGKEASMGFRMVFDPEEEKHIFTVYKGIDRGSDQEENRPARFSMEFNSLSGVKITDDMSIFCNVAYVGGGGEGDVSGGYKM